MQDRRKSMSTTPLQFFTIPGTNIQLVLTKRLGTADFANGEICMVHFEAIPDTARPGAWRRECILTYPERLTERMNLIPFIFLQEIPYVEALPANFFKPFQKV
ncbi:hypothetical protein KAZ66_04625 [Candidatus Woesebacteria bacterium]|nr:hypothetical protein [Candidatus Woesebacteria bacterium]